MTDLSTAAAKARVTAYAPYSNYLVGAAVRSASGTIHSGCNVENAAYPLGNCAETSAIAAMVAAGETRIAEVFVMTSGDKPGTPCGGCRQRLAEFAGPEVKVHCGLPDGTVNTYTMGELLPHAFDLK